jgi:hypothetical protein
MSKNPGKPKWGYNPVIPANQLDSELTSREIDQIKKQLTQILIRRAMKGDRATAFVDRYIEIVKLGKAVLRVQRRKPNRADAEAAIDQIQKYTTKLYDRLNGLDSLTHGLFVDVNGIFDVVWDYKAELGKLLEAIPEAQSKIETNKRLFRRNLPKYRGGLVVNIGKLLLEFDEKITITPTRTWGRCVRLALNVCGYDEPPDTIKNLLSQAKESMKR